MSRWFLVRLPRRLIFLGMALIYGVLVWESAVAKVPERFPDWYPVWFWAPVTLIACFVSLVTVVYPTLDNVRLASVVGITWCLGRAVFNGLERPLPFPGLVGVAIWLGFALILLAVGMALAVTGPITDGQRETG